MALAPMGGTNQQRGNGIWSGVRNGVNTFSVSHQLDPAVGIYDRGGPLGKAHLAEGMANFVASAIAPGDTVISALGSGNSLTEPGVSLSRGIPVLVAVMERLGATHLLAVSSAGVLQADATHLRSEMPDYPAQFQRIGAQHHEMYQVMTSWGCRSVGAEGAIGVSLLLLSGADTVLFLAVAQRSAFSESSGQERCRSGGKATVGYRRWQAIWRRDKGRGAAIIGGALQDQPFYGPGLWNLRGWAAVEPGRRLARGSWKECELPANRDDMDALFANRCRRHGRSQHLERVADRVDPVRKRVVVDRQHVDGPQFKECLDSLPPIEVSRTGERWRLHGANGQNGQIDPRESGSGGRKSVAVVRGVSTKVDGEPVVLQHPAGRTIGHPRSVRSVAKPRVLHRHRGDTKVSLMKGLPASHLVGRKAVVWHIDQAALRNQELPQLWLYEIESGK